MGSNGAPGRKESAQFAWAIATVLALIGTYRLYVVGWRPDAVAASLLSAAVLLLVALRLSPRAVAFIYRHWRRVAGAVGFVVARALLILLYIVVMTPTALAMRLTGTDPLAVRKSAARRPSYWLKREAIAPDHYRLLWSEAAYRDLGGGRPVRLRWFGIALSFALFFVGLAVFVESGVRIARSLFLDGGAITLLRSSPNAIVDAELGWRSPRGEVVAYRRKCYGQTRATYSADGLRILHVDELADKRPHEIRICVLGDSVTQAYQLSDGLPYYHRLQAMLRDDGYDVTALGAGVGGFGTLQQTMMFERACRDHAPDMVLWQFSDNDLINNSYRLERWAGNNSNFRPRPYLEDGEVRIRHPAAIPLPLDSLTMRIVNGLLLRLTSKPEIEAEERVVSLAATRAILERFLADDAPPIVAFFADGSPDLEALVDELGIPNIGAMTFEDNLENCRAAGDGHPNSAGHRKMAAALHEPVRQAVAALLGTRDDRPQVR